MSGSSFTQKSLLAAFVVGALLLFYCCCSLTKCLDTINTLNSHSGSVAALCRKFVCTFVHVHKHTQTLAEIEEGGGEWKKINMSNALREDALQKGPKSCLHFMVLFLVNKAPVEIRKRGFHFWKSPEFMFCLFPKCKVIFLFVEQLLL